MSSVGATAYAAASSRGGFQVTPAAGPRITRDPIRILIVEDLRSVADALEAVLSRQPGMVVVGNLGTVTASAPRVEADIVILEFRLTD